MRRSYPGACPFLVDRLMPPLSGRSSGDDLNLILILRELWYRRVLVAIAFVAAVAISVLAIYQVSVSPPSLSKRVKVNAQGSIEILVDSARSPIADARRDLTGLTRPSWRVRPLHSRRQRRRPDCQGERHPGQADRRRRARSLLRRSAWRCGTAADPSLRHRDHAIGRTADPRRHHPRADGEGGPGRSPPPLRGRSAGWSSRSSGSRARRSTSGSSSACSAPPRRPRSTTRSARRLPWRSSSSSLRSSSA